MQWLQVTYQPTTLFSLKPAWATSSGGKSLLLPTPFAVKMALLDVAIRSEGLATAKKAWPWLRDLSVSVRLPDSLVVNNLFQKILRKRRGKAAAGSPDAGPFQKTIGYREYVYYPDALTLALGWEKGARAEVLAAWMSQINYLGKRGGFMQMVSAPVALESDGDLIRLTEAASEIDPRGIIQQVDDCGPRMTFAHANIYNEKRLSTGSATGRIFHHIVLPYRLARSSRNYSLYERIS